MYASRFLTTCIVLALLLPAWAAVRAAGQELSEEVSLNVARFGPGNLAREGSWTGLRVEVTDQGLGSQREIVLRVRVPDPDGDEADYDRVVTSNAGLAQAFWLYVQIPPSNSGVNTLEVLAYEAVESEGDDRFGFRAGRLLGRTQVSIARAVPAHQGLMGVIGSNRMGLDDYGPTGEFSSFLPLGHEMSRIASGLDVNDIPDRWQGLAGMDAVVWGSTRGEADPGLLSPDKARAVRDWVERGGHLVVVLPSVGEEWFSTTGNPLAGLLPRIEPPVTLEGVDLGEFRALLTSDREVKLPGNGIVRLFERAPDAGAFDAMPILNDAQGRCVVMRRVVGCGAVTLVGIDLSLSGLRAAGLPDGEVLWHRVLGRRGVLASVEEIEKQQLVQYTSRLQNRTPIQLDVDVDGQIAMRGTAAIGVALGFVVFLAYWLIAGPVGFVLLGRAGMRQHAWSAFVVSVAVFTAAAWIAATASRPHRAVVRHVTLLQAVYGQETQRARSWMAVLSPFYGDARVSVGEEGAPGSNLISPLRTSAAGLGLGGFPDNRAYRVEARSPYQMVFPSRSTVKELEVEWAGRSGWVLPEPIGQPGDLDEPVLRLTGEGAFDENGVRVDHEVSGELVHDLPGPLEDVVVLVNTGQVTLTEGAAPGGRLTANVLAYELSDAWAPDVRLSLAEVTRRGETPGVRQRQAAFLYLENLLAAESTAPGGGVRADPRRVGDRLKALALFSQLEPPSFREGSRVGDRLARRDRTHGYDLGVWFTQPCVMVLGRVSLSGREARGAVPVRLGGSEVPCEGLTFVMWVYPLEPDPPEVRRIGDEG